MSDLQKFEQEPRPLAVRSDVDMQQLFMVAMDKGPDIVERMMAVRRELKGEAAKAAFDQAMAAFQDECPQIVKTKGVPTKSGAIAYKYVAFESILQVVKPLLKKHGFKFKLDTDTASADGWVIATCEITHESGHSETSKAKFPLGTKTEIMSVTQQYAAALTFASRRVFCNALGIVTVGEDIDGQTVTKPPKPRGPTAPRVATEQTSGTAKPSGDPAAERKAAIAGLWELLRPIGGAAQTWDARNSWLRVNGLIGDGEEVQKLDTARVAAITEQAKEELAK